MRQIYIKENTHAEVQFLYSCYTILLTSHCSMDIPVNLLHILERMFLKTKQMQSPRCFLVKSENKKTPCLKIVYVPL